MTAGVLLFMESTAEGESIWHRLAPLNGLALQRSSADSLAVSDSVTRTRLTPGTHCTKIARHPDVSMGQFVRLRA